MAERDDRWQEPSVGRQLLQEGQQAAAASAKVVADTAASFQVRFAAEAEDSAGGGELLWDDMNIVVLPVSTLAARAQVSRVPSFSPFECIAEMAAGTACGNQVCALTMA